ncbi:MULTISPECIES: hypothetical protein [Clostridium]|uniref:Conserved protein containing Zn-finger domain n=1 Tax=Clostridium novyi (strain NT) TaxID=386415 RepID=A0Q0N3_CLONN|nr:MULTISPECIES: hypothetical protein [Clostridium]ABK60773.1 conserved protein containing Zn-finger domain [Clostridium novyi NT]KEH88562.1 hypothetical protein Z966_00065 [Clostridium novyi A str. NCTC 538]KEH89501.1 hypothetical protein Z967_07890 [Clostridium novyi A str. 4540]KEH90671.1 hypothetical protein Z965_11380 [Clostridium novyi A str. BKT29909]KEH94457.1 hypothetical protein Z963_09530 [Clostridium botulinum C/D str. It1]
MAKLCILELNKECNDCGECNKCDLNPNKKCNNCGRCLELEGYDTKAINIEQIFEEDDDNDYDEEELELTRETSNDSNIEELAEINKDLTESEIKMEYIDDIDGLKELIDDDTNTNSLINEVFPGFMVLGKSNK